MTTIYVESSRINQFKHEFTKFTNKIVKLGFAEPIYTISELKKMYKTIQQSDESIIHYLIDVYPITIDLEESYKLNGWCLYSTIRYDYGIIIPVDINTDTPDGLGLSYNKCDHCGGTHSRRKISFIVKNGDVFKQVGSSCVKDFLGISPNSILKLSESFELITSEFNCDESEHKGGCFSGYDLSKLEAIELSPIYDATFQVLSENSKYIKKEYAENQFGGFDYHKRTNKGEATIDKVEELLKSGNVTTKTPDEFYTYLKSLEIEQVEESVINDIISIRDDQRIRRNQIHLPILAVVKYLKSLEVCLSEHQGVVGNKLNIEATITDFKTGDGRYGEWKMFIMVDGNGNIYKKFGSFSNDLCVNVCDEYIGSKLRFTADVKSHEIFNDKKITVLGRMTKYKG